LIDLRVSRKHRVGYESAFETHFYPNQAMRVLDELVSDISPSFLDAEHFLDVEQMSFAIATGDLQLERA
jgi:hypothetical protein